MTAKWRRTPEERTHAELHAALTKLDALYSKPIGQPVSVQNDIAEAASLIRRAIRTMEGKS